MFSISEEKEIDRLERKISRVGTPLWKAGYVLRKTALIGATLYALSAGVQTMMLLDSDAYRSRESLGRGAYIISTELAATQTLQSFSACIDSSFSQNEYLSAQMRRFAEDVQTVRDTRDEFVTRIERIYNPLKLVY